MRLPILFKGLLGSLALGALALGAVAQPVAVPDGGLALVRLTTEQYQRTIRDVFGAGIKLKENKVAPGVRDEGLLAIGARKQTIGSAAMEQYEELALDIARQVVEPRRRSMLLGCAPKSEKAADPACAQAFFRRVGLHLFRRPLTDPELQMFVASHVAAAGTLKSFDAGIVAGLTQMLVAPEYLFRVEYTEPDPARPGFRRLDAYGMASRLSFFLWDSPPDAELLAAAQGGKLQTPDGLRHEVERMVASPRLEQGMRAFFSDMLGFDQFATLAIDTTLYPRFTKNVLEDADEQTLRTIVDHLLVRNGSYGDLFTTPNTFLTPALAALYGVPLPRSQELGGAVPWVAYRYPDGDPRVGLLSHASFLSLNSHPGTASATLRGKALREKLLCQKVPPPPGNIDFSLVTNVDNAELKTARKRLTAHSEEAMCAGCHKIMDPMGLALENFDAAAGFRTHEHGERIDVTGALDGRKFDGLRELAAVLKASPVANNCVITRAYTYGTQRKPTRDEKEWLAKVQADLPDGVQWRPLMRRIALHPEFYGDAARPATLASQ